jgi:hypothetical protein
MALIDLTHSSILGPNNPGSKGTGNIVGPNTTPLANFALGNPDGKASLFAAAGSSLYGPTSAIGTPGPGFIPDPYGNIPPEITG